MRMSETASSDATVEEAFEAHVDKGVREQACKESGALSWEVTITEDGDTAHVQVDRVMPPLVPDFVKKFLGDSISVRHVENWGAPDASGARTADVKVTIKGQPASMVGTATLKPEGSGSVEIVDGEVKVAVPFIGRKIEPEIVKVIASALRVEQRVADEWVKSRR